MEHDGTIWKSLKINCWNIGINRFSWDYHNSQLLVGGIPTPLKNMNSSVRIMTFPIYGKMKAMCQTTNQVGIIIPNSELKIKEMTETSNPWRNQQATFAGKASEGCEHGDRNVPVQREGSGKCQHWPMFSGKCSLGNANIWGSVMFNVWFRFMQAPKAIKKAWVGLMNKTEGLKREAQIPWIKLTPPSLWPHWNTMKSYTGIHLQAMVPKTTISGATWCSWRTVSYWITLLPYSQ